MVRLCILKVPFNRKLMSSLLRVRYSHEKKKQPRSLTGGKNNYALYRALKSFGYMQRTSHSKSAMRAIFLMSAKEDYKQPMLCAWSRPDHLQDGTK